MQDFKPTYSGILLRGHNLSTINLELRIVYYKDKHNPRIWIRSPGTSHKIMRNMVNDLVPIFSGKDKYGNFFYLTF